MRLLVTFRSTRTPVVGDKFASRAGQKGILSLLYDAEDMPFSESGIVPDILFNPHGFPSRMTVGMMIESMAGKVAALSGELQDGTPFRQRETPREADACSPVDYFGKELLSRGYSYYGKETLYSGVHGAPIECDIFTGVIYYQRLRHMVNDKYQCRNTGPIDALTHQPLKGRKRKGGTRVGEMERDSLLSHGASFTVQDRLLNCSDGTVMHVCAKCGVI
uniref:DNA-directed RNA polymerase n=1 Tax=Dermatophagoides pteronyssinus TaxID=6956 RepID=A0A6P6Y8P1_DERPT